MKWKNGFGLLMGPSSLSPLPDDFIFGVASADHQCEAHKEGWDDIRDDWEPSVRKVKRGNATEFWERYRGDIKLAKKLGCRAFRFSISWSRVENDPETSLRHYEDLVNEIISAKMEPVLTLHHFVWPPFVDMIVDDFPDDFRLYVAKVVDYLGDKVKYWVPINEPNNLIWGYIKPFWDSEYGAPPGKIHQSTREEPRTPIETVGKLIPNLYRAYARAYDEIKSKYPNAEVGTNPWIAGFPPRLQWLVDSNAERMGKKLKSIEDWKSQKTTLIDHKAFDHGRSDIVLATLSRTPNREQEVNFSSEIYFETDQRLLVRADSKAEATNDLAGKAIAVVKGSTAELSVQRLLHLSQTPVSAKDSKSALDLLDHGHVDAFLSDCSIIRGLIEENDDQYRILKEPLETELYAAAVTQGYWKLLKIVDRAVWWFKESGEWERSYAKHIDSSVIPKPPTSPPRTEDFKDMARKDELTSSEKEDPSIHRILKNGVLRVAVKSDAIGLSHEIEKGEFS
jgi:hypothetical protein